jgi:hypothetical protein
VRILAEADAMSDPDAKRIMLEIATGYRRLAESATGGDQRKEPPPKPGS